MNRLHRIRRKNDPFSSPSQEWHCHRNLIPGIRYDAPSDEGSAAGDNIPESDVLDVEA